MTAIVGLVGGIASGKSYVARVWAESFDGVVLSADEMAHKILDAPDVQEILRERFGEVIFSTECVDRATLARVVFANPDNLRFLESLIHPRVEIIMREQIKAIHERLIIIDAPLLLEAGLRSLVDYIVFVDTPDNVRRERAKARGWSDAEWSQRESRQWSLAEKRAAADIVIDGALDDAAITQIINTLL